MANRGNTANISHHTSQRQPEIMWGERNSLFDVQTTKKTSWGKGSLSSISSSKISWAQIYSYFNTAEKQACDTKDNGRNCLVACNLKINLCGWVCYGNIFTSKCKCFFNEVMKYFNSCNKMCQHVWQGRSNCHISTSHTACMRNSMWYGSAFSSSAQVIFLSTTVSHLIQAPCCLIPTSLQILPSSTAALISSWTSPRFSFPLVELMLGVGKGSSPSWPHVTILTRLLWRSISSACCTASSAFHFPPVLAMIPALATFGSLQFLFCTTSCHLELSLQGFEWQLQSVAIPVQGNAAKAPWQPNPSLQVVSDHPL